MQAYITFCQCKVNGNFIFLLCFAFSTSCGFLYKHVEILICRGKYKDQPRFCNVILRQRQYHTTRKRNLLKMITVDNAIHSYVLLHMIGMMHFRKYSMDISSY